MANKTNSSSFTYDFEYYMDYLDLLPVDAGKLKANRYSIVIALWIGLASFVAFLFLILFYISRSGSTPMKLTMAWFGLLLQASYCVTSLLLVLFLNQGTGAKRSLTNQNHDDLLADIKP